MPANKGGESKQGLIITLVVFILLCISLGVLWYQGFAEQEALKKAKDEATREAETLKKHRIWYQMVALQLKGTIEGLTDQEKQEIEAHRSSGKPVEAEKAPYDKLADYLNPKVATVEPYRQRVVRLEEELKNSRASLQAEKNNLAKERADHARAMAVEEAKYQEADGNYKKAQAENVAIQQKMAQELSARLQAIGENSDELAKTQKKAATDVQILQKEQGKLRTEVKEQEAARIRAEQKLIPPDLQKFSSPKGRIVNLDLGGQLAWINLGSLDNVRTQQGLTFSIFGSDVVGRGSTVRKGALEVVEVQGPHVSKAKITETTEPRNNPIQPGDLLVNPAWSPTMQQHVAIAGLIDFTGDGRDQIDEFMRALTKQNIVVDAYLDLKDATVKGKIDLKTDYLVVGDQPEFGANTALREGDARFDRKMELRDKIAGMQNDAQRLGVTVVPLRRFASLTGYQVPRGARSTSGFSYDSRIPPPSANGEAKDAGKKEKAKEEKKEEGK